MGIYIPNITIEDLKHRPSRFVIGSKGVSLEITDGYGAQVLKEEYVEEVKFSHSFVIDRDEAIRRIEEYIDEYSELDNEGLHDPKWCAMHEAKMVLENLPSVEREIV